MKEYIEREALIECNAQCKKCFHFQVCASVLKQQLFIREKMLAEEKPKCSQHIPAADVVERKRGEWMEMVDYHEDVFKGYVEEVYYNCLECDYATDHKTNYCPNCGADMRGEKHEAD